MFPIFEQEKAAAYGMIICFVLSIGLRFLLGMLYRQMIRETDNMATTNNRLLKQCKLKFTNCFQLNNGVSNVSVFVEKFLTRLSLGPFSFGMLYHVSGQLMLLSVICSGIGVCRSIMAGCMFGEILPFYICSLVELYFYFSITTLVDIKGKRKSLKINLVDYLENHLSNRMYVTRTDMNMLYGTRRKEKKESRGLEILPIAGWLADRDEEIQWEESEVSRESGVVSGDDTQSQVMFEEGEAEALEDLLKEILSLS